MRTRLEQRREEVVRGGVVQAAALRARDGRAQRGDDDDVVGGLRGLDDATTAEGEGRSGRGSDRSRALLLIPHRSPAALTLFAAPRRDLGRSRGDGARAARARRRRAIATTRDARAGGRKRYGKGWTRGRARDRRGEGATRRSIVPPTISLLVATRPTSREARARGGTHRGSARLASEGLRGRGRLREVRVQPRDAARGGGGRHVVAGRASFDRMRSQHRSRRNVASSRQVRR